MSQPTPPAERHAFISHAHNDNKLCAPYAKGLKAQLGEDAVWYDLNNNPEGHLLAAVLQRELQARQTLVVFVTPAALDSFWVGLEIDAFLGLMAQDRARMLLPVRLAPCEMPPFMNAMAWIDAVNSPVEETVRRIVQALSSTPPRPLSVTSATSASTAPTPQEVERALHLVEEARQELLESRWNDAIIRLRFVLSFPGVAPTADILSLLAQACAGAGRWVDALDAAQRGSQADLLRADLWQIQGRARTALARALRTQGGSKAITQAEEHEREALLAFEKARAIILREDDAARLALLAEQRATLTGAERWAEALETVDEELALAPNNPTRLAARLDLQRKLRRARLVRLGFIAHSRNGVEYIVPPLCSIPAIRFRLGSDKSRDQVALDDEVQRRIISLTAYEIGRFPVTVAEYQLFCLATGRAEPKGTHNPLIWAEQLAALDHPVVNVTWRDAFDYAKWMAQRTGQPWRLPTEAEWENAARCDPREPLGASSERIYPWGDEFDVTRCNGKHLGLNATSPVGWYGHGEENQRKENQREGRQSGVSPCGVEDMAGNVWEWTASAWWGKDYERANQAVDASSSENRVVRGGGCDDSPNDLRAAYRNYGIPDRAYNVIGFRLRPHVS